MQTSIVVEGQRPALRLDAGKPGNAQRVLPLSVLAGAFAMGLLAWAGWTRDLSQGDATLGIAATERFGPFGQALGGWIVTLPAGRMLPSWGVAWLLGSEARGQTLLVHGPALLGSLGIVILGMLRCRQLAGNRAACLCGVALAASLALADRPSQLGFDPVVGFVLLAAIDRILTRGSDWIAGLWTMAASLMIGWPALVIVGLPTIVIGRASSYLSWRLVVPSLLAIAGWSAWALSTAQAEVWGAWLVAPIKQPLTWDWLPWIVALTLPWSPFALLVGLNGVRGSFPGSTRRSMLGWLQVSLALGLAATFLPGLVMSALPVAFGLVVVACSSLSRVVSAPTNGARMAVLLGVFGLCLLVSIPGVPYAAFLAAALPHYRPPALLTSVCLAFVFAIAAVAAWQGRVRWSVGCLVALALLVKLVHAEIYTPEWTYRLGQGPWGRAIGQWVPPNQPIYSVQTWPVELAFATERSMRTLVAPGWLDFVPGAGPHYVLLLDAEFQNWPVTAPKLQKMRSFQDPFGRIRVLARTIPKGAEPR